MASPSNDNGVNKTGGGCCVVAFSAMITVLRVLTGFISDLSKKLFLACYFMSNLYLVKKLRLLINQLEVAAQVKGFEWKFEARMLNNSIINDIRAHHVTTTFWMTSVNGHQNVTHAKKIYFWFISPLPNSGELELGRNERMWLPKWFANLISRWVENFQILFTWVCNKLIYFDFHSKRGQLEAPLITIKPAAKNVQRLLRPKLCASCRDVTAVRLNQ